MNKTLLIIVIFISFLSCKTQDTNARQITPPEREYYIETTQLYVGKNIYVLNPHKGTGLGFCVDSVLINQSLLQWNDIANRLKISKTTREYIHSKINTIPYIIK